MKVRQISGLKTPWSPLLRPCPGSLRSTRTRPHDGRVCNWSPVKTGPVAGPRPPHVSQRRARPTSCPTPPLTLFNLGSPQAPGPPRTRSGLTTRGLPRTRAPRMHDRLTTRGHPACALGRQQRRGNAGGVERSDPRRCWPHSPVGQGGTGGVERSDPRRPRPPTTHRVRTQPQANLTNANT